MNLAFGLMYFWDTANHRYYYLNVFCFGMPLLAINNLYVYGNTFVDQVTFGQELCWLA